MPWTVKDVDGFKKGLTPAQKKKWVKTANGVLKDCLASGGSNKSCEGKAIRIANSKFSEEGGDVGTMEKVPKLALTFANAEDNAVQLSRKEGEEPKLQMLAYSGKVIKGHWWWGDLAIDLSGMQFTDSKYPVLEDHNRSRKIAFIKKPKIDNYQLIVENGTFVDTDASQEFQKLSRQGFPYQASIHAEPTIIEKVGDGEKTEVNGFTFKGPGTVWRKSTFREVSVCVFGWDKNTKSEAMGDVEINYSQVVWDNGDYTFVYPDTSDGTNNATTVTISTGKEVKDIMTLEELREKDPEGYKDLMAEAADQAKKELQSQHEKEKTELSNQLTEMRTELEGSTAKMKELEKKEAIRAEKERQMSIERECQAIWVDKLAESDLSESAKRKLPDYVDPKKHLSEEGDLNIESFTAAVEAEIKYWTEEVGATTSVLGLASNRKQVDEEAKTKQKEEEEDDGWVERMVKLSGQIQPQQTT
ncbi:MAG: hypothetical protein ACWGQW_02410 [bacterium]